MPASQVSQVLHNLRAAALAGEGADWSDGKLLAAFLEQRDEAAFEALVRRHGRMVLGVCLRVLGHHHDAEDAFQATFLVLARKAASVRPRELVGHWLYGVAYQTARKARALATRRKMRERQVIDVPEPIPVERDDWAELRPLLDQELSRLPEKYRIPIVLCDLEGKPHKEAAQLLGWPQGTVSGRLTRARQLLAKRLTRHRLTLTAGTLAVLLSKHAVAAAVSPALTLATTRAACWMAAGQAVTVSLVSAQVAALTEGVVNAMVRTKLQLVAAGMVAAVLVGLGAGLWSRPALAGKAKSEPPAARPARESRGTPPTVSGLVASVAAGGKTLTIEIPSRERGVEPEKRTVTLTDKNRITFSGVGPGGAKLTEGYGAQVWIVPGSKDVAARVQLTGKESARQPPNVAGTVSEISKDGKTITVTSTPRGGRDAVGTNHSVRITADTIVTYSFIPRGGAKPTKGYTAQVWLKRGSKDTAALFSFIGLLGRAAPARASLATRPDRGGKVVGVAKDSKAFFIEVPSRVRGEEATKEEIEINDKTQAYYVNVGPNGDRPTEGYFAQVWMAEGDKDTASRVIFRGVPKERQKMVSGKVSAIAKEGKSITVELPPSRRGEEARQAEVKLTPTTRVVYSGVGPGGAKPTVGYQAQVWLEEGSEDTAALVLLTAPGDRR